MVQKLRPWKTILSIEVHSDKPVYRQIAEGIIAEIKRGRFKPGTPLPSTRQLAESLTVNRKTIVLAYEDLLAEGWLTSVYKKGTFVSGKLPQETASYRDHTHEAVRPGFSFNAPLLSGDPFITHKKNTIVFDDGLPDVRLAPMNELARSYRRIFQQNTRWRMMGYGNPAGCDRIRGAIADMLVRDRGLRADTSHICITRGSQMALYLTAKALIQKGDYIAVEDPGYAPAWTTFTQFGAKLLPLKVDAEGICIETLEKLCKKKQLKAIYVTPHHQFPTTVSMKVDRRIKLVELSNQYGFAIIEDDYDHEFHFQGKSMLPLASLPNAANVIYISSLSKLVAPSVRIGYILAPGAFIAAVAAHRKVIDVQGDSVMEHAVAELMEEGAISRHVRKAYRIYGERRESMDVLLQHYLGDKAAFTKPAGGLAYWISLRDVTDTRELATVLLWKGVSVIPTEQFSFGGASLGALRLGYASLTPEELEKGIRILGDVL